MQDRRVVAVAGTHGKTTDHVAAHRRAAGLRRGPLVRHRGELNEQGSNAHDGSGEICVAEADESDGAFLVYSPHGAVVTNVEADHLDNYGTEGKAYRAAFSTFLTRIRPGGFLVAVLDDPGAAALAEEARRPRHRRHDGGLGLRRPPRVGPALRGDRLGLRGGPAGTPARPGAPADPGAPLTCSTRWPPWGPGCSSVSTSTRSAPGSSRSPAPAGAWSSRARPAGCASTTAMPTTRTRSPAICRPPARWPADGRGCRRLPATPRVTDPDLRSGDGRGPGAADEVVVMDVYVAREDPEPGVDGALVGSHVPLRRSPCTSCRPGRTTPTAFVPIARPGDVVLTLGAGDVTRVGPEVLALLEEREQDG